MSEIIIHRRSSLSSVHELPNDLLAEIFLCLPLEPLCLLWASFVCKHWYDILHNAKFLSCFRSRHTPPILGFLCCINLFPSYMPIIAGPRFSLPSKTWQVLHCRHGRVLFFDLYMRKLLVWNPISSEGHYMTMPLALEGGLFNATVLCAASHSHHGDCHSRHFDVVFVSREEETFSIFVYVYSSETGQWCDPTSISTPCGIDTKPPALVGDTLYWSLDQNNILEFDLDKRSLARTEVPLAIFHMCKGDIYLMPAENGRLGFATVHRSSMLLWSKETDSGGSAILLLRHKINDLHNLFTMQRVMSEDLEIEIVGMDEDGNVIFIRTSYSIFMVQLKSLQFKKVFEGKKYMDIFPYTSFYISGGLSGGVGDGAEVFSNM